MIAFETLDDELKAMAEAGQITSTEGSTATVSLLLNDDLYVAHIGDSAAILIGGSENFPTLLCKELDTAENFTEAARIEQAGGVVLKVGHTARVQGELALTRSFGAVKYKPYVTAEPHLLHVKLAGENNSSQPKFLVIGTDGLWKVLSPNEVEKVVAENKGIPENEIAEKLYEEAVRRNAMDNIDRKSVV